MKLFSSRALLIAVCIYFCAPAMAGIVISGTRVVYPAQAREVTVQLENIGDSPSLVQAWIDAGDPDVTPENSSAGFILTPPISRVEGGKGQALRIMYTGAGLPQDRESLFFLNVLEIPPSPEASADAEDADQNYLQVAFRSRLKLFYRPRNLRGNAADAPAALRWSRISAERIQVSNPSAYHVSLAEIVGVGEGGVKEHPVESDGAMLNPGQTLELSLSASYQRIRFASINDYGGRIEGAALLIAE